MKFEYKSNNFIPKFKEGDTRIKIYDKNKKLKYNIEPIFDYSYLVNNCIVIKIVNKNDIKLSFESKSDAVIALNKLLEVKSNFKDQSIISSNTYSTKNLNMSALNTSGTSMTDKQQLACEISILDIPTSMVRVYVNGVDVNVGNPIVDNSSVCFFAPYSGLTLGQAMSMARNKGEEKKGDYLYWLSETWEYDNISGNGSGYELEISDMIDFVYLVSSYTNLNVDNEIYYSTSNFNMNALNTNGNGSLACSTPILNNTESTVDVLINGNKVKVGNPLVDNSIYCFFAPNSGYTGILALFNARNQGEESLGDYLYWIGDTWNLDDNTILNGSGGFELESIDKIDFIYKTK